ncbi:MAG: DUF1871 family protein [Oscillospiraceae bacterium]|nr:DUF1871 family protein [Oscillospiraceae bacterium]
MYILNGCVVVDKAEKKRIKKDVIKEYLAVKKAIDIWNPYDLLPDAPDDEFDRESLMVARRIKDCDDVINIAEIVSDVFQKQFVEEDFPLDNCIGVATAIHESLLNLRSK